MHKGKNFVHGTISSELLFTDKHLFRPAVSRLTHGPLDDTLS
jgi:hypothetical protein